MRPLDRKLYRDLWHIRGQIIAIALVVACGVAAFVAMQSNYRSLIASQDTYYAEYRFADLFTHVKRAPESLTSRIAEIPGVSSFETRVAADVILDVPGVMEPATGRLVSIPSESAPVLNALHIESGRYPELRDEVVISGAFSRANSLKPGATLGAVINGRWQRLRVVGIALSPEFIYEIRGGDLFPDNRRFGVLWMNRKALGAAGISATG